MVLSAGKIAVALCVIFIGACICKSQFESTRQAKAETKAQAAPDTIDDDNPTAGMKLELVAAHAKTQDAYETFTGKVQNTGTAAIPNGEITLYLFNAKGSLLGTPIDGVLDVDPLPPGGVSTFKVMFEANENAEGFGLGFTTNGSREEIPLTRSPGVSMKL